LALAAVARRVRTSAALREQRWALRRQSRQRAGPCAAPGLLCAHAVCGGGQGGLPRLALALQPAVQKQILADRRPARRRLRRLSFRKFRNDRLQSSCGLRGGFARGCGSRRHGNRRTKPGKSFFGFLFPLRPAKTLGGSGVPAGRFRVRADLLMDLREFKRNHGIACAFIQRRKLTWGSALVRALRMRA